LCNRKALEAEAVARKKRKKKQTAIEFYLQLARRYWAPALVNGVILGIGVAVWFGSQNISQKLDQAGEKVKPSAESGGPLPGKTIKERLRKVGKFTFVDQDFREAVGVVMGHAGITKVDYDAAAEADCRAGEAEKVNATSEEAPVEAALAKLLAMRGLTYAATDKGIRIGKVGASVPAAPSERGFSQKKTDFLTAGKTVEEAVQRIATAGGLKVTYVPGLEPERRTRVAWNEVRVTVEDALKNVLRQGGLGFVKTDRGIVVFRAERPAAPPREVVREPPKPAVAKRPTPKPKPKPRRPLAAQVSRSDLEVLKRDLRTPGIWAWRDGSLKTIIASIAERAMLSPKYDDEVAEKQCGAKVSLRFRGTVQGALVELFKMEPLRELRYEARPGALHIYSPLARNQALLNRKSDGSPKIVGTTVKQAVAKLATLA